MILLSVSYSTSQSHFYSLPDDTIYLLGYNTPWEWSR